jgi:hypothetical protein
VEIIGGDEESLREFIQRWFAPHYPGSMPERDTLIWIGKLPDEIPADFPLPPEARIVASVQDQYTEVQVIADVQTPLGALLDTYPQTLNERGWQASPEPSTGSGFVSAAEPWFNFCNEEHAALTFSAFPLDDNQTEIRTSLYTQNTQFMCDPQSRLDMDPAYEMIPALKMPPGAVMTGGGSSSGDGTAESTSDILTDMNPEDLNAHFSNQLGDAGWQFLDGEITERTAWSSWLTTDQDGAGWNGMLVIIENPGTDGSVFALFRVVRVRD